MLAVELVTAVGGEDQHPGVAQPSCHVVEQLTRRRIGPVQVLEHQQHAVLRGSIAKEADHAFEEAQLSLAAGITAVTRAAVPPQLREELAELAPGGAEPGAQAL